MQQLDGRKALIVDDDEDFRLVVIDILKRYGMCVVEAPDGRKALGLIDSERPDLVILDQRLPRLNGLEVTERMRRGGCGIPIILITAADDAEELAELAGVSFWLRKPFALEDLVHTVARAVS